MNLRHGLFCWYQSCRAKSFGVDILDCDAERLTLADSTKRIVEANPRLVCFVMYGQNPNSGTANMAGAELLAGQLKKEHPEYVTCFVGSHVSALPKEVLALPCADIVLLNEGVYALHNLLLTDLSDSSLDKVKGIGYKMGSTPVLNQSERVVPQERMDVDLPGYAWDLLPYREKPLDLYRAHFWHADFNQGFRTPFAALYTSLGCVFKCSFCMINIVNRIDNNDDISATNSPNMRFWSPEFVIGELEKLARMGIETVRISDEMFFLNKRFFGPLVEGIIARVSNFACGRTREWIRFNRSILIYSNGRYQLARVGGLRQGTNSCGRRYPKVRSRMSIFVRW